MVIIELARQLTTGPCFKVGHTVVGHYINVTLMVNSDVMKILSTQHETTFLKVSAAHVFCLPLCADTHHKHDVLSLPAGHSLTWYVFWSWWSFQLPSRLLFQTWYELVCRRSSANFRLSRWKPHFSGTNIGAMFDEKRGRRTRRTPGRTSFPSTSAQVSKLASKQLYLSQIKKKKLRTHPSAWSI